MLMLPARCAASSSLNAGGFQFAKLLTSLPSVVKRGSVADMVAPSLFTTGIHADIQSAAGAARP